MDGPQSGLSVCLIVRDEERSLPRALASVVSVANEICVLDTGSRDRTPEVAQSFGARVNEYVWQNDFSAARNVSLKMAQHQWILVLDADEELQQSTVGALRAAIEGDRIAWLVSREDLRPRGTQPDTIRIARLFRNDPRIRYRRPVHEDISDSLFAAGVRTLDDSGVRLTHYGYLPEVLAKRDKRGRNLAILRQRVLDRPRDVFSLHKLAQSLIRPEQADEQLAALESAYQAAEQLPWGAHEEHPYLTEMYDGYASNLARNGKLSRAISVVEQGLARFPGRQELLFRQGDLARRAGDARRAQVNFTAALGRCRISTLHERSKTVQVRALLGLGLIALDAASPDDVARVVERARQLAPKDLAVQLLEVELAIATHRLSAAARRLGELLEVAPYHPGVKLLGGRLAWLSRSPDVATEIWRSALGACETGDLARIWLWLADAALGSGLADVSRLRTVKPRDTRTAAARTIAHALTNENPILDPAFHPAAVERQAVTFLKEIGRYGQHLHVEATAPTDPPPLGLSSLFPEAAE